MKTLALTVFRNSAVSRAKFTHILGARQWTVVENRPMPNNRIVQRKVLYLGEISDNQLAAWCKTSDVFQYGEN